MGQTDSKEISLILYGIINGQKKSQHELKCTYLPLIEYISDKYNIELQELENDLFKYIEDGINEYLFANRKRIIVEYADPFSIWFLYRLSEFLTNNNQISINIDELINNKEVWSLIKPVILINKSTNNTVNVSQSSNKEIKYETKINEYKQKKVMSLITLVVLAICIYIYNYMPETYTTESEGVQYTLTLNKRAYRTGDEIIVKITLKNISDKDKTLMNKIIKTDKLDYLFDSVRTSFLLIPPGKSFNTDVKCLLNQNLDPLVISFYFEDYITDISIPIYIKD